jgi:hypothetical protein
MGEEEKKGFFFKIQEKYESYKKEAEQKQLEKLEKEKQKTVNEVSKWMNDSLKDLVSLPTEFKPLSVGGTLGVVGGFTTKDNVPVVSYITIRSYEKLVFPMDYIFGSFAERPIPTSIIAKKISTRFMRSERVLIPFESQLGATFDAKEVWERKTGWNPLVEAMNNNKALTSALTALPNQSTVFVTSKRYLTYKIDDANERNLECQCQIIPYENLAFIGVRTLGLVRKDHVKNIVNLFRIMRGHILSYGHAVSTSGHVAQDWINLPIFIMNDYFLPVKQALTAKPKEKEEALIDTRLKRFLVSIEAYKKAFVGEKKGSFSYLIDAENPEEAKKKVIEMFNEQQVPEGFSVRNVSDPTDMTAIGADVSKQYPLGMLLRPILIEKK